jgi:hypothetical protein
LRANAVGRIISTARAASFGAQSETPTGAPSVEREFLIMNLKSKSSSTIPYDTTANGS